MQNPSLKVSLEVQRTSSSDDGLFTEPSSNTRTLHVPIQTSSKNQVNPPCCCATNIQKPKPSTLRFLAIFLVFRQVAGNIITGSAIQITTGAGTNQLAGAVQGSVRYIELGSPYNANIVFTALNSINSINGVRAFEFQTSGLTNVASASNSAVFTSSDVCVSGVPTDTGAYVYPYATGNIGRWNLQKVSGTYSFVTQLNYIQSTITVITGLQMATTNYIVFGPWDPYRRAYRLDFSTMTTSATSTTFQIGPNASRFWSNSMGFLSGTGYVFFMGYFQYAITLNPTNMAIIRSTSHDLIDVDTWVLDNLATSIVIASVADSVPNPYIRTYDATTSTSTITHLQSVSRVGLNALAITYILNFGVYRYFGYVTGSSTITFVIARKVDLVPVSTSLYTPLAVAASYWDFTLTGYQSFDATGSYYFGYSRNSGTNYNLMVYQVTFGGNCVQAASTGSLCQVCTTTTYLEPIAGLCYALAAIPAGKGLLTSGLPMTVVSCANSQCSDCRANKDTCVYCNANYYVDSAACLAVASVPSGFGFDSVSGGSLACQTTNCDLCRADYHTCTKCMSAYYLDNNGCYLISSLPAGQGYNTVTYGKSACAVSNCMLCQADSQVCTRCLATYYLDANACGLISTLPDTQGYNAATFGKSNCATSNCKNCRADYATCVECLSTYYLDANTCGLISSLPAGQGYNSATLGKSACTTANCLDCRQNYAVCVQCSNTYYLGSNTCAFISTIPSGEGYNSVTFGKSLCAVSNCMVCQANYQTCNQCIATYYLDANACGLISTLAAGQGYNPTTFGKSPCQDTHCGTCTNNYQVCTQCVSGYYLQTGTCPAITAMPVGFGYDSATGGSQACAVASCSTCRTDYQTCTGCSANFYLSMNTCHSTAGIPAGQGYNSVTNGLSPCSVSNCGSCQQDYLECSRCGSGYFLDANTCKPMSQMPIGSGLNPVTGGASSCLSLCLWCTQDSTSCDQCSVGYYWSQNSCQLVSSIPSGFGYDNSTKTVSKCLSPGCNNCQADAGTCKSCIEFFELIGAVCQQTTTIYKLSPSMSPYLKPGSDLSWLMYPGTTESDKKLTIARILNVIAANLQITVKVTSLSGQTVEMPIEKSTGATTGWLTLDLTFADRTLLKEQSYNVTIYTESPMNLTDVRFSNVSVIVEQSSLPYTVIQSGDSKSGLDTGAGLASSLGGSVVQTQTGSNFLAVLLALDPSGVSLKLSQMLKIVSRLYYVNMNYGDKLDAFLFGVRNLMPAHSGSTQSPEAARSPWRGKLSKDRLPLDPWEVSPTKTLLYLAVSVLDKVLAALLMHRTLLLSRVRVPKAVLHAMYWWPKAALLVFNTVQLDFVLYGARGALQAVGLSWARQLLNYAILVCLSLDFGWFLQSLFEPARWTKYIRKVTPVYAPVDKTRKSDDPSPPPAPQDRPIDYEKTYKEIEVNYHLIELQCGLLRPDVSAVVHPFVRACFVLQLARNFWFQLAVVAGQYATGLLLLSLIAVESGGLLYTVAAWLRHRHLKGVVLLLMESLQRVFLVLFMSIAFWYHTSKFGERVPQSYQNAGIFVVILACATEYLMMMIYVGMLVRGMLKKRQDIKTLEKLGVKAQVKRPDFLRYVTQESASLVSTTAIPAPIMPSQAHLQKTDTIPKRVKLKLRLKLATKMAPKAPNQESSGSDPQTILIPKRPIKLKVPSRQKRPLLGTKELSQIADIL